MSLMAQKKRPELQVCLEWSQKQANLDQLQQEFATCGDENPSTSPNSHLVHRVPYKNKLTSRINSCNIQKPHKSSSSAGWIQSKLPTFKECSSTCTLSHQQDKPHSFQWRLQPKLFYIHF